MNGPRVLIAGVGNIFLGDDAFGVEVVQRLARRPLPKGVRVVDFGIRGIDLVYALLEDYDGVVLVDAVPHGGKPGTLYVLEPDLDGLEEASTAGPVLEAHSMDPVQVLRHVRALGGPRPLLRVVGCEPSTCLSGEEMQGGLSEPVAAAVEGAITIIAALVHEWLHQKVASCTSLGSPAKSSIS
jgi:hydrogenase maturation protease